MPTQLDQLVKGAAPTGTTVAGVTSRSSSPELPTTSTSSDEKPAAHGSSAAATTTTTVNDPLSNLPSSPPQIYLNLLILEASLRSQYLTLRARRRQNTFFLVVLGIWNLGFFYLLFLQPREDGSGIGGSVYWVIEMVEKMGLLGGIIATILVWGTGQWERGMRWPRRFVATTNRGLRVVNLKIIVVKRSWYRETLGLLAFFNPWSNFYYEGARYHYVESGSEKTSRGHHHHGSHHNNTEVVREEDLAPGGDAIRLLLLPKPFSADFRENWETYRSEYWEKENERRSQLLQKLKAQQKQIARARGGVLAWLGLSSFSRAQRAREADLEMKHARQLSERDAKRIASKRAESHSRNASRSSTPGELDDRPPSRGSVRRGSGTYDQRRRLRGNSTATLGGGVKGKESSRLSTIPAGQTPLKRSESMESEAVG